MKLSVRETKREASMVVKTVDYISESFPSGNAFRLDTKAGVNLLFI